MWPNLKVRVNLLLSRGRTEPEKNYGYGERQITTITGD